jgi:hypothetical protein
MTFFPLRWNLRISRKKFNSLNARRKHMSIGSQTINDSIFPVTVTPKYNTKNI